MNEQKTKGAEDLTIFGASLEDSVVGTWFARLGVLALLIGAAFGYRYGVDRKLIGPEARVATGVLSGSVLIGWGHFARRKQWVNFAHALSGGGVAILFLSVLAAQFRFELISPAIALTLLSAVALLSAWLAVGYDSMPLAIMATLGAFMNPYFMAADDPVAAMTYVVGVDVAIVGLAFYKRWSVLNKLALVGSIVIVALVAEDASLLEGLGFTSVLWVLFSVVPFIQALREGRTVARVDAGLEVSVGFLYLGAGLYFLEPSGSLAQGLFVLAAGLAYAALALFAYFDERTRVPLTMIMGALAVGFVTLAAPLMTDGPVVHLIWALQGALLLYVGGVMDNILARVVAVALIVVGILATVEAMSIYRPGRFLTNPESLAIAAEIGVLYLTAWIVSRSGDFEWRDTAVQGILVVANLLTLGWLSQEVRFELMRSIAIDRLHEVVQFALSGLWATYSAALVVVGVTFRQRWARYLGLATFGLTIVKMLTVDLWQLEVLQRTVAFVGLGVLMIGCSFMYNRFRDLIIGAEA